MKIKKLMVLLCFASLMGCGGSEDDTGNPDISIGDPNEVADCTIVLRTINLASGESCEISEEDAELFNVTAGAVECSDGVLTYGGNQFTPGDNGLSLNGLIFVCS